MKKLLSMIAVALVAIVALTGCSTKSKDGGTSSLSFTFGQVTDKGGVTDKSFNQGAYEGIEKFATDNGGSKPSYLTSKTDQEMEPNLTQMAGKVNVVVASGFNFESAVVNVSKNKPENKFVLIDGKSDTKYAENVSNISFAEQEAGYLAGVAAAKSTKTKKVGFVGGMEIPPVQRFAWGFIQGVYDTDSSIEIMSVYTGKFDDTALGKTTAASMYGQGVDIIFHAAGGVGIGVINEASEQRAKGKEVWVIGVDKDQYEDGVYENGKSVILTSAMKRVDEAAYQALESIKNNEFAGGKTTIKTVKENAVGLPAENPNMSDDAKKAADEALAKIKDGTVKPPSSKAEVTAKNVKGNY